MTYHIFIGYDEREHEPFQVAKFSLEQNSTVPVKVHKLHHKNLRQTGLFTREWTVKSDGQYVCNVDKRTFSTQFSHSRFLVPELWRNLQDKSKSPLVMFVDCDFVFLHDIKSLFEDIENKRLKNNKAVPLYCVHHDYNPENTVKMDNVEQTRYNRKLWSSLMVFDMESSDNAHLLPEVVNSEDGRWLHNFGWVRDPLKIGVIDESWNFIPNHSEKNTTKVNAIHYTNGGPWFENYKHCRYSQSWNDYYNEYLKSNLETVDFNLSRILHD